MLKIISICMIVALTGCYQQASSNTSDQTENDEYVYEISDLSICKKDEIKDNSIFYSSSFSIIDTNEIYSLYFDDSSKNDCKLLSPIKMTPYTKVNENPVYFVDMNNMVMLEDGSQKVEINQNYSRMDVSSLTECTITIYFYPIVSQNERNELVFKTVQMDSQTYCDGIYEIRIDEV